SGSKTFITNAPYADTFVVYARVDDVDVRAFIVERGAGGLSTGKPFRKMGMHASPTGEVFLDDVFVPGDQIVGGEDAQNARAAARSSLKGERFGMTPMCLGILDRCLEESVRYAKQRTQWGKPIATYQLVQEKIARMYTARSIVHALLMRQLEADRAGVALSVEEASASKLYCARITTEVALEAVQLKGGAGYMQEGVVEMLARDAKLFQIGGGTDEIQMLRIAREVLGEA
ncbi:MAG: acyl-CoA dehydrogenase family protein, partial [Polyangiaceae bacterium]